MRRAALSQLEYVAQFKCVTFVEAGLLEPCLQVRHPIGTVIVMMTIMMMTMDDVIFFLLSITIRFFQYYTAFIVCYLHQCMFLAHFRDVVDGGRRT